MVQHSMTASEIETWRWKVRIGIDAETAIDAAAALPPFDNADAWLAADRILSKYGERFPSCALPSEFGRTLSTDADIGGLLLPDLWTIISAYTVDPRDAVTDRLAKAIAARAYCRTVGKSTDAETIWLRQSIIRTDWQLIEGAFMRLFYAQSYDLAERVVEELLSTATTNEWINLSTRMNLAVCLLFRGEYDAAAKQLFVIEADKRFTGWSASNYKNFRWYRMAQAWSFAAFNDCNRASAIIDEHLPADILKRLPILTPFVNELRRYLQQPTVPPVDGLMAAHANAVAALKTGGFVGFRPLDPDVVFDAPRPPKTITAD